MLECQKKALSNTGIESIKFLFVDECIKVGKIG